MLNDLPTWTPTVQDVASRLIARTRQPNGVLAKTFNSLTTPTDADVLGIINQVTALLVPRLGDVPDRLADTANALVALKAACIVEASYFAEQIGADISPYKDYCDEFRGSLADWDTLAKGDEPNGVHLASLPVGTLYPSYEYQTW